MLAKPVELRAAVAAAALAAIVCWPGLGWAQQPADAPRFEEAPMPPRIDDVTPAERTRAAAPETAGNPNRARLAPLPEDRAEPLDEIVVTGEEPWRQLPDLGSAWRAQRDAEIARQRYVFSLLPRDGTPAQPMRGDPFLVNPDGLPSAEIYVLRWRFGRRDDSAADDAP